MGNSAGTVRRGFTLVEILCVVVILGIAGAIIVPQITSRDDLRARAAARRVMSDLIYAQNRAITYQEKQYVRFADDLTSYTILSGSGMATVDHPVTKMPYVMRAGAEGPNGLGAVQLASADFTGQSSPTLANKTLAFDELGTPYAADVAGALDTLQSGTVVVQTGNFKVQISVTAYTGQITVKDIP